MTAPPLEPLTRALENADWLTANLATRRLLGGSTPGQMFDYNTLSGKGDLLRAVDAAWAAKSAGRFGFAPQKAVWASLGGGPHLSPHDRWDLFYAFGKKVGWKHPELRQWYQLETPPGEAPMIAVFPPIKIPPNPEDSPAGFLPFHDVLASFDMDGFSPRDCWGESLWDGWAILFESL